MTWREVDLQNAVLEVPAHRMKTNEAFSVPLSDRAVEILVEARQRARREPTADSFVFAGTVPRRPLSPMSLAQLLRRMGADAVPHGFRSSFRMWAAEIGHVEFEIAEAALSHRVGNAVSRAYNRSNLLERRRPVMAAWSNYVEGQNDANVAPLRRA